MDQDPQEGSLRVASGVLCLEPTFACTVTCILPPTLISVPLCIEPSVPVGLGSFGHLSHRKLPLGLHAGWTLVLTKA